MITYPKEELTRQIDHIIREEGAKPVIAAQKLQKDMETSLAEVLGILIKQRNSFENSKQKNDKAPRRPIGETIILLGRGWGYGMSSKGMASYYRYPQTGKIVWTDLPLEYQFRKRSDLSSQVWKAVEEQEQMVLDVIQGGRALRRNVKDIAGDIEQFINYPNGGEKVVGRWMGMFPNTEEGRRKTWKREYLAEHGGLQPGSDDTKVLLKQPDAQEWISQKMTETTKRGTPRLPAAVKQYASWLGKAGLDYRTIRIARIETAAMLADEQTAIEEIIKAFKEEMAEDLEMIQGTQEQADMLADIDRMEKAGVELIDPDFVSVAMPGDPKNKIPAIKIECKNVDYSKLSNDEAIYKEAVFINKLGAEKKHEIATLISRDGNKVLSSWEGTESRTNLSDEEYRNATKGISRGDVDLIHCHLRGTLFADDDMNTMCRQKKLGRVIVTFPNNEIYALSVVGGHRPSKKDIYNVWGVIYGSLELQEKEKLGINELLPNQKKKIINEVCKKMASMYGWKLEKI